MATECHSDASGEKCGFVVHLTNGWLGASPDGRVMDPTSEEPNGVIEIKCPYSKREMSPEEACNDTNFYCHLIDSKVCLEQISPVLSSGSITTLCWSRYVLLA